MITQPPTLPPQVPPRDRPIIHGLAALRGWAMLLGVLLHAVIAYLPRPVPGLLWPVHEPSTPGVEVLYWFIHGFRVPLFFLIAGMFAAWALDKHGPREFFIRRARRLGVPLIAGTLTIVFPLMYVVWVWGWVSSGAAEPKDIRHFRFSPEIQSNLYGFSHLWFLEYLLMYCGVLAVWRKVVGPRRRLAPWTGARYALIRLIIAVACMIIPTMYVLWWDPRCLFEFHNGFLPRASEVIFHGWFFTVGVVLAGAPQAAAFFGRRWWVLLAGAGIGFWGMMQEILPSAAGAHDLMLAGSLALYAWCMTLGLLGIFANSVKRMGGFNAYWSTRAYFVYVVHPPFVGLVQVLLFRIDVPGAVKIVAAFAGGLACSIALYAVAKAITGRWRKQTATTRHE